MSDKQISVHPFSVARFLGAVAFLLVLASIGVSLMQKYLFGYDYAREFVALFYVDREQNIPTFFSLLLLLLAFLLLAIITVLNRKQKAHDVLQWAILTFGFLLMAFDEAFEFHEKLILPVRSLLHSGNLGIFYFAWVIPGILLIITVAIFYLRFLLHLPATTRLFFITAAALYVGGAIGFELIGGRYVELHGTQNLTYSIIATIEESLEMAGVIVFIWALLAYIANNYKEVTFRLDEARSYPVQPEVLSAVPK